MYENIINQPRADCRPAAPNLSTVWILSWVPSQRMTRTSIGQRYVPEPPCYRDPPRAIVGDVNNHHLNNVWQL